MEYKVGSIGKLKQDGVVYDLEITRVFQRNGTNERDTIVNGVSEYPTGRRVLFELETGRRLRVRVTSNGILEEKF